MRTLIILCSELEANLAGLDNPDETFPRFSTIGPEPTYSWVGCQRIEHRNPPSADEIAAICSFAAALLEFADGLVEWKGWRFIKSPRRISGDIRSLLVQLRGERREGPYDFWNEGKFVERFTCCELAFNVDYVWDEQASILEDSNPLTWCAKSGLQDFLEHLPRSHHHHRSLQLQPHKASPILEATQAGLIAKLPYDPHYLRGWVITGPPGTSKTTYAATALVDMWTMAKHKGYDLLLYRVEVPDWLAETHAWDTRDFDGEWMPPKPEINTGDIKRAGGSPVLWLEELDKFKPTETRLNYLYRLVNAVYEMEGLIIVTCNDTEAQLRERLGPAISRRIFGDNDDPSYFKHWALFAAADGSGKQRGKTK